MLELTYGLQPESLHGNMCVRADAFGCLSVCAGWATADARACWCRYVAHGGRLMEFEKEEEVFKPDRLHALVTTARHDIQEARPRAAGKLVAAGEARMYQASAPAVTVTQLLDALRDGQSPNSPELARP